jgi:hypothetical protein
LPVPSNWLEEWVQPRLSCEVAFTEWTSEILLRHPIWRRLRHGNGKNSGDLQGSGYLDTWPGL